MLIDCLSLKDIIVERFDKKNIEYMTHMFNTCRSLTSLKLSNFNTTNLK
jgi:surface protein